MPYEQYYVPILNGPIAPQCRCNDGYYAIVGSIGFSGGGCSSESNAESLCKNVTGQSFPGYYWDTENKQCVRAACPSNAHYRSSWGIAVPSGQDGVPILNGGVEAHINGNKTIYCQCDDGFYSWFGTECISAAQAKSYCENATGHIVSGTWGWDSSTQQCIGYSCPYNAHYDANVSAAESSDMPIKNGAVAPKCRCNDGYYALGFVSQCHNATQAYTDCINLNRAHTGKTYNWNSTYQYCYAS